MYTHMYRNNRGLREWSLDPKLFTDVLNTQYYKFNITPNAVKFYSQQDEDKYIIQYILKQKITDGTYLEIGGCDGVLYSNTKTLEDHFGFSGIIIEPQQHYLSTSPPYRIGTIEFPINLPSESNWNN